MFVHCIKKRKLKNSLKYCEWCKWIDARNEKSKSGFRSIHLRANAFSLWKGIDPFLLLHQPGVK